MVKWLEGGEQTRITPRIEENKEEVFRKRTSHEIIDDGFVTGCTDETLVFLSIARACGIPSKYVEGINNPVNQAEDLKEVEYTGHVIAECKLNNKWYYIDVIKNEIFKKDEPSFFNDKFKIIAKGLDSWDLNIGSYQKLIDYIDENSSKY